MFSNSSLNPLASDRFYTDDTNSSFEDQQQISHWTVTQVDDIITIFLCLRLTLSLCCSQQVWYICWFRTCAKDHLLERPDFFKDCFCTAIQGAVLRSSPKTTSSLGPLCFHPFFFFSDNNFLPVLSRVDAQEDSPATRSSIFTALVQSRSFFVVHVARLRSFWWEYGPDCSQRPPLLFLRPALSWFWLGL